MGKTVDEVNKITDDIVSFDMRPEDTEVYMKYIAPLPPGSKVVDFGTGMAKNVIRMALCAPHVEIWTWDWGHGNDAVPHKHFKLLHDTIVKKGAISNIYFVISDSEKAWKEWDWSISVLNIDASHDYKQTILDLERWEPFIVKGGYIFIHDYEYGGSGGYKFEGMRAAVKEYFINKPYKFLEYLGGTQVIQKL